MVVGIKVENRGGRQTMESPEIVAVSSRPTRLFVPTLSISVGSGCSAVCSLRAKQSRATAKQRQLVELFVLVQKASRCGLRSS